MGRRSRKRIVGDGSAGSRSGLASRAERDTARRQQAVAGRPRSSAARRRGGLTSPDDRPPAPWGSFPLVEIFVALGIVLFVAGFLLGRPPMVIAGLAIGSLAGLELSVREHFGGFRSHSSLLAMAPTCVAVAATFFLSKRGAHTLILPVGAFVFLTAFWWFRRAFARRSGGVAFRR